MSALGDAGQHDVHDDDSAHDHKHGDDRDGDGEDRAGQLLPESHDRVGSVDAEIVVVFVSEVAAGAHQGAGFVFEFHHLAAVPGLHVHVHAGPGDEEFAEGREGDLGKVVLALPERGADFASHADDFEGMAADEDDLAHRVHGGEEFVHQVLADEADHGAVEIVRFRNKPAVLHLFLPDVDHAGRDAPEADFVDGLVLVTGVRSRPAPGDRPDVLVASQVFFQEVVVLDADGLVSAALFQPVLIARRPLELVKDEHVGTEVGDMVGDIEVHPVDD